MVVLRVTVGQKDTSLMAVSSMNSTAVTVLKRFHLNNYIYGKVLYISRLASSLLFKQPF